MATMGQEIFESMASLYGKSRATDMSRGDSYHYTRPLNDHGFTMDVLARYWIEDGAVDAAVVSVTYFSADGQHSQPMPLAMFSGDALTEICDEVIGEIQCEQYDEWLAREG